MGEGSGILVIEELEHAIKRGAHIYAEILGYGANCDAYHITAPDPEGEGAARCMELAIKDAGIEKSDISYINAHGTSTKLNDAGETRAIKKVFGDLAQKIPVSSTKSMTGHECWMAGASEAVYSILMMQNNFVAPNINLENVIDEAKGLNIVRETVYAPIRTVLSNSSGMGGTNSALVFRKI
jgi:3-oxoacyl-[acyl-carrier-protein] synthase II